MVSDILASVLARDPDLTLFHTQLHPRLKEILQRCLEKDPKRRWQAIGDVRIDLERLLATGEVLAPVTTEVLAPKAKLWMVLPWVAAAVFAAASAAWVLKPAATRDPRPIGRFEYELPETQSFRSTGRSIVAFSPDGRHFAYNTSRGLFLRSMDSRRELERGGVATEIRHAEAEDPLGGSARYVAPKRELCTRCAPT